MNLPTVLIRVLFWSCLAIALLSFFVSGRSVWTDQAAGGASLAMIYFPITMGIGIVCASITALTRFAAASHLSHIEKSIGGFMAVVAVAAAIATVVLMKQH